MMTTRIHGGRGQLRESRSGGRQQRGIVAVYSALSVALIGYTALIVLRPAGQSSTLLDGWGVDAFELIASGLCIANGLCRRTGRVVPLMLGIALTCWALGDLTLTIESLGGVTPATPSVADAFYLAFFPFAYVALVLFIRGETTKLTAPDWLDGAVAGLGAGALCAAFAFRLIQHSGQHGVGFAVNLAYPVGDVLLLLLVVGGSALLTGRQRPPWSLVAAGIAINILGDTSNLLHASHLLGSVGGGYLGGLVNQIAWPISILLMSMAMWIPRGRSSPVRIAQAPGFVLPGLAAATGLTILYLGTFGHINRVATGLAAATLLTVVVRTGLSVRGLRALTRERQRLAITDHLTGLGNRRHLFDALDAAFVADGQDSCRLAFLFIDLDGFKQINDSFGHPTGDEILGRIGARLAAALRGSALLTRVGGDEFAVVLTDADAEQAAAAAQRLSDALQEPFLIDVVNVRIGASIGIALAPLHAGDGARLMWCADVAMYRAKLAGSPFALYDHDFDSGDSRLQLADQLHDAIHSDQLTLHYQPQLDLHDDEIITVEALVRWWHPTLGLLAPPKFLPLAEEAGLMGSLTRWVLDEALAQCAAWRAVGHRARMSVNISANDLVDPGLLELVTNQLELRGLSSDALVLEITETTLIDDFEHSKRVLTQLRELGVGVSIDDFGAGFTSLTYLSALAVDELKLDRSFISPMCGLDAAREIELVRATIDLGHALRLRVVAEGIENSETLELLRALGCDLAQGYFIGKPVPADQIIFEHQHPDSARTSSTNASHRTTTRLTSGVSEPVGAA
jgi:diguanylate cyclase